MNNQPPPDDRAELEARVTALLLGELSAEDAAAMRQILARDAGLAKLHERLRLTLDLVRESAATPAGELTGQPVPLKLSPARREALLAHFKTLAPREFARPKARRMSLIVELAAAAAILLVAAGLLLPSLSRAKNKASVMAHIDVASVAAPRQSAAASKANLALKPAPPPASPIYLGAPSGESSGEQLADQGLKPNARGVSVDQALSALSESEGLTINRQADTAHAGTVDLTSDKELTYNGTNGPGASPEGGAYSLNSVGYVNVAAATSSFSTINASDFRFYTYAADSTDISDRLGDLFPEPSGMSASKTSTLQNPLQQRANSAATLAMSTASSTLSGNTGGGGFGGVAMGGGGGGGGGFGGGGGGVAGFPVGRDSVEPKLGDIGGNVFGFQLASNTDGITLDVVTLNDVGGQEYLYRTNGPAFEFSTPASEASQRQTLQREAAEKAKADAEAKLKLSLRSLADESAKAGVKKEIHPVLRSFSEGGNPPSFAKPTEGGQSAIPLVPPAEIQTRENAFSTFSLNVSDVSFKLAAASLQKGLLPESAGVRSEEFINAFDYRDSEPAPGAPVGFAWERAGYPFAHNRDLLRFAVKTAAQGRQTGRPLNLVLLVDKSGSMERADRVAIMREALRALATQLQAQDTLSIVVFARTARLFADGRPGSEAGKLADELEGLTPDGGTNLEEAMKLAYEAALRHYRANGENRVVILTDGAANLGNVEPDALRKKVAGNRAQGIALDCFGVGWEDYNDDLLELLSRSGGGRYGFLNTPEEAATGFAGQLAGALRVAASDVKVQVEFNPDRVTSWRQIGYAKDQLKKEEFRDNSVKAAQLSVAESGNALYTVELNPDGVGPICTVHVRYRAPGTADYYEHAFEVPYTGVSAPLDKASPPMRLAATASAFSEWLASNPYSGEVTPDQLLSFMRGVPEFYGADTRPGVLVTMIREAKSITGK